MRHVKAEVERLTILNVKKPTRGQKLRLVRSYAIKLFDAEPEEVKAEVTAEYERRKEEVDEKEAEEDKTPQAMAEYVVSTWSFKQYSFIPFSAIRTIPAHFTGFAQFLSGITGWRFTLLAGGPDPKNGGEIKSVSYVPLNSTSYPLKLLMYTLQCALRRESCRPIIRTSIPGGQGRSCRSIRQLPLLSLQ